MARDPRVEQFITHFTAFLKSLQELRGILPASMVSQVDEMRSKFDMANKLNVLLTPRLLDERIIQYPELINPIFDNDLDLLCSDEYAERIQKRLTAAEREHLATSGPNSGLESFLSLVQTMVKNLPRDQCNTIFGHIQDALMDVTDMTDQQPYILVRQKPVAAAVNEVADEEDVKKKTDAEDEDVPPAKRAKL